MSLINKGYIAPIILIIFLISVPVLIKLSLSIQDPVSTGSTTNRSISPIPKPSVSTSNLSTRPTPSPTKLVTSSASITPTPTPKPTSTPISTQALPDTFTDANTFRDYIISTYGFTTEAGSFIKANSSIVVKNLDTYRGCGGGFWIPWEKKVELNCAQHEAALHELSHVWWHTRRLQHPDEAKNLAKDVVRLAKGDGPTAAVEFAKGYIYGIGDWKGMYCTNIGCTDISNIQDSDFDLSEAATNAKIIDWEIYAGLSSWTMGSFKSGTRQLPSYMWKYFEPQFTGNILITPYYDGGHP